VITVLKRISSSTIKSEAEIATTILRNTCGEKVLPPWIALCLYLSRLLISAMVRWKSLKASAYRLLGWRKSLPLWEMTKSDQSIWCLEMACRRCP
jgi:hypothetical protein